MADSNTHDVPIRPASTLLLLAERPDLQVLMLKRNEHSAFVGDMWLFPGGAVDAEDGSPAAYAAVTGLDDHDASRALEVDRDGLAYWVAALRETFEEAGVLLARQARNGGPVDLESATAATRFDDHRRALNDDGGDFLELVRSEGLTLSAGDLGYVSRWITPRGLVRRYDTRFFAAAMPDGQVPAHDNDEAVHHEWITAEDALEANASGEMLMVTPTVAMLLRLAAFASVDEALASAAAAQPRHDEAVRIRPGIHGPDRLAFPADPDYSGADPHIEHGVVRWPLSLDEDYIASV